MKGLFIPGITAEMFRNGCLESIEALMAEGEIYDIECDPSADAVEVVRCEDCRWYKTNYMWNGTEVKICAKEAYEPRRNADDFCSYGEKKDD